jgi:hypothetical protein
MSQKSDQGQEGEGIEKASDEDGREPGVTAKILRENECTGGAKIVRIVEAEKVTDTTSIEIQDGDGDASMEDSRTRPAAGATPVQSPMQSTPMQSIDDDCKADAELDIAQAIGKGDQEDDKQTLRVGMKETPMATGSETRFIDSTTYQQEEAKVEEKAEAKAEEKAEAEAEAEAGAEAETGAATEGPGAATEGPGGSGALDSESGCCEGEREGSGAQAKPTGTSEPKSRRGEVASRSADCKAPPLIAPEPPLVSRATGARRGKVAAGPGPGPDMVKNDADFSAQDTNEDTSAGNGSGNGTSAMSVHRAGEKTGREVFLDKETSRTPRSPDVSRGSRTTSKRGPALESGEAREREVDQGERQLRIYVEDADEFPDTLKYSLQSPSPPRAPRLHESITRMVEIRRLRRMQPDRDAGLDADTISKCTRNSRYTHLLARNNPATLAPPPNSNPEVRRRKSNQAPRFKSQSVMAPTALPGRRSQGGRYPHSPGDAGKEVALHPCGGNRNQPHLVPRPSSPGSRPRRPSQPQPSHAMSSRQKADVRTASPTRT